MTGILSMQEKIHELEKYVLRLKFEVESLKDRVEDLKPLAIFESEQDDRDCTDAESEMKE